MVEEYFFYLTKKKMEINDVDAQEPRGPDADLKVKMIGRNKAYFDERSEIRAMEINGVLWERGSEVVVETDDAQVVRVARGRHGTISGFAHYTINNPIQVKIRSGLPVWFSDRQLRVIPNKR